MGLVDSYEVYHFSEWMASNGGETNFIVLHQLNPDDKYFYTFADTRNPIDRSIGMKLTKGNGVLPIEDIYYALRGIVYGDWAHRFRGHTWK